VSDRSLRRWAFLSALVVAVTFALVLAARLALDGPSLRLGAMTTAVFAVLPRPANKCLSEPCLPATVERSTAQRLASSSRIAASTASIASRARSRASATAA
jgi:hypothetical protein